MEKALPEKTAIHTPVCHINEADFTEKGLEIIHDRDTRGIIKTRAQRLPASNILAGQARSV
ncbi:MAG: hypothetical protein ACU0B7_13140 [Paracoccaceae bacterium]